MALNPFLHVVATLIVWTVRLAPAPAVGSLLIAFEGNLKWLGLFGLPLLHLALRGNGLGCVWRGCGLGRGAMPTCWPAP